MQSETSGCEGSTRLETGNPMFVGLSGRMVTFIGHLGLGLSAEHRGST